MWLDNVFLKTLRDCRVAILGWGLALGAIAPIIFVAIPVILDSPGTRKTVLAFAQNPALALLVEPVDVLSPGGYATWRLAMLLPMLAIWALLAVSRVTRGEEESGAFDVLLSAVGSRWRIVVQQFAAIAAALALIGILIAVLALAGARASHVNLEPHRASLFGLNVVLLALVFGALAFVVSQFTRERRSAAGVTGMLLGVSFVLTSAGRGIPGGEWIARLSPLYYFELNKPLVTGYAVHAGGLLVMAALVLVLTAVGLLLFVRRDIGAPCLSIERYLPPRQRAPMLPIRSWSVRSLLTRAVRSAMGSAIWWGVGLGTYSLVLTALLRQVQRNLDDLIADLAREQPAYAGFIDRFTRGGHVTTNMLFLNAVFTLLVVVVAAFAVSLANRWAGDEEEGRLDLLLAAPKPRYLVMVTRFAAGVLGLAIVTGSIFAGTALAAAVVEMELDTTRVAAAAFGMVPVGFVVASIGYLLAGWLRTRIVTGILIGLVFASFVVVLLGPLFGWPAALLQLSIFEQYGAPLADGFDRGGAIRLFGVGVAALAAALIRFGRKDIVH